MKGQAQAKLRFLRLAPRKVRLLADLIRGRQVNLAQAQLSTHGQTAARPVLKLLNSAIANAVHNHDLQESTLVVKTIFVDGGPVLDRWSPKAMGRATPIRRRTSHVTIVLEGDLQAKKAKEAEAKKNEEPKPEVKKVVKPTVKKK